VRFRLRLRQFDRVQHGVEGLLPGELEVDEADADGVGRGPEGAAELALEAAGVEAGGGDGADHELALALDDRLDAEGFAAEADGDQASRVFH
jgi:hypothetical protein